MMTLLADGTTSLFSDKSFDVIGTVAFVVVAVVVGFVARRVAKRRGSGKAAWGGHDGTSYDGTGSSSDD